MFFIKNSNLRKAVKKYFFFSIVVEKPQNLQIFLLKSKGAPLFLL